MGSSFNGTLRYLCYILDTPAAVFAGTSSVLGLLSPSYGTDRAVVLISPFRKGREIRVLFPIRHSQYSPCFHPPDEGTEYEGAKEPKLRKRARGLSNKDMGCFCVIRWHET